MFKQLNCRGDMNWPECYPQVSGPQDPLSINCEGSDWLRVPYTTALPACNILGSILQQLYGKSLTGIFNLVFVTQLVEQIFAMKEINMVIDSSRDNSHPSSFSHYKPFHNHLVIFEKQVCKSTIGLLVSPVAASQMDWMHAFIQWLQPIQC